MLKAQITSNISALRKRKLPALHPYDAFSILGIKNNADHNPIAWFFRIQPLASYNKVANPVKTLFPTLQQRIYTFKANFQIICIEIMQTLLKGKLIQYSFNTLWKLIHHNTLSPFYSMLPIALGMGIVQPLLSFYINRRKNHIESDHLRQLMKIASTTDGSLREKGSVCKDLSKDKSSSTFHRFASKGISILIEGYLYLSLLGPMIFTSVILFSAIAFYTQSKISNKINFHSNKVKEEEGILPKSTSNEQVIENSYSLIHTKSLLAQWKYVRQTINELTQNLFTFGLMLISATLVLSGQYEIALIAIQFQTTSEAFKCASRYFDLSEKWGEFQTSTQQLLRTWQPKANAKDVRFIDKDKYIKGTDQPNMFTQSHTPQTKRSINLKRIALYAILAINTIALPLSITHFSLFIPLILTYVRPLFLVITAPMLYYKICKRSEHVAVEEISWKLVGYPLLALLTITSSLGVAMLLKAPPTLLVMYNWIMMLPIILSCVLAADYLLGHFFYDISEITLTFLSQQTFEYFIAPAKIINYFSKGHFKFKESQMIRPDEIDLAVYTTPEKDGQDLPRNAL